MAAPPKTSPALKSLGKTDGTVSVARVRRAWYVVCTSEELQDRPLGRKLLGVPMVIFRGDQGIGALLDRCPHRNVPLSLGKVAGARIQCGYHGWEFEPGGRCEKVPSLCSDPGWKRALVPSFPVREKQGYVWVWADADSEPDVEPYDIPLLDTPGYTAVRRQVSTKGTLLATIENALDVPHTAFLHGGLFRKESVRNKIKAIATRDERSVQVEYVGEPRPTGIAAKILSPTGGEVIHFDRFIMPCVAQVEYRIGEENHFLVTSMCTPVDDFVTDMYAVVAFKMRLPGAMVKVALEPIALRIFSQDAEMLEIQTQTIERFGGETYTSTEIDLMGPQVWRLLRRAEQGKAPEPDDPPWRREITMEV